MFFIIINWIKLKNSSCIEKYRIMQDMNKYIFLETKFIIFFYIFIKYLKIFFS